MYSLLLLQLCLCCDASVCRSDLVQAEDREMGYD